MKNSTYEPNENVISQREIERRYQKLLTDVKEKEFYTRVDLTNRVNCYTCQTCGHITKTKDVDAGVTPMFFNCEKCNNSAASSFYTDIAPKQEPTFKWFRPELKELLKMRKNSFLIQHILDGGLHYKKLEI